MSRLALDLRKVPSHNSKVDPYETVFLSHGSESRGCTLSIRAHALFLRPTGLASAAYRDQADYTITEDGRAIGRIYEDRHTPPELRWFWSITIYVDPKLGIRNFRTRWLKLGCWGNQVRFTAVSRR
jgi:hypothetical protein